MLCLWSALFAFASTQMVTVKADQEVPEWIIAQWQEDAPNLADVTSRLLAEGTVARDISITAQMVALDPQRRDIFAYTEHARIHIDLKGEGWEDPSSSARRALQQNLSHEVAHVYQLALVDYAFEPRWLHEGFAEALSLEILMEGDLWSGREVDAYRTLMDRTCEAALAKGPLVNSFETGEREASYACGAILIETVAELSQQSPSDLLKLYAASIGTGQGFIWAAKGILPNEALGQFHRFVHNDYSRMPGDRIIASLRSGRL